MKTTFRPRRDFSALEKRRMKAVRLYERKQPQAEVVRRLGVSRQTASRWYATWSSRGSSGLKSAGRAGRKPRLDQSAMESLEQTLLKGPEVFGFSTNLWTMERVAAVIRKTCEVDYHPRHMGRILGRLGWSRQRPARQAKEKDVRAVARWTQQHWKRVKKTPNA